MQKVGIIIRRFTLYAVAGVVIACYPATAYAETSDLPSAVIAEPIIINEEAAVPPPAGPDVPPELPPALQATDVPIPVPPVSTAANQDTAIIEKPDLVYTYNPETKHWDSNQWRYNETTKKYEAVLPPVIPTSLVSPATSEPTVTMTSDTQAAILNSLNSIATSGNTAVSGNTLAGNAMSGDATAVTTIFNNINSSITNDTNQKAATFVTDVMGNVEGDIMLYPLLLKAMMEAQVQQNAATAVNVSNDAGITNNVSLQATSGDAAVIDNNQAGSATTGNAHTVANVMNLINSMVASNQSFVGTVNIYGNLDGDILIAPDFIPQLLAANPQTPHSASTSIASTDKQDIINNIVLAADSGSATIANNTQAGSATTGDALTNLVLFNLSGHQIIAKNSLLVFVNVLGQWVGVIVDAPTGATAAAIGSGVMANNVQPDLVLTSSNTAQIINNIDLTSRTGDALVAGNTRAGNATSGTATASANVLNMTNSQLALTDWFGVLFINVFGTWNGSLGIDTAQGNRGKPAPDTFASVPAVIQFVPRGKPVPKTALHAGRLTIIDPSEASPEGAALETSTPAVLGKTSIKEPAVTKNESFKSAGFDPRYVTVISAMLLLGVGGAVMRKR